MPRLAQLSRIAARSILEALIVFSDIKAIHTDINPNNSLISGLDTSSPTVKVADLGMLLEQGIDHIRLQGLAIRAPEVWRGLGCWPVSDVWSLGVTVKNSSLPLSPFSVLLIYIADQLQMVHWLTKRAVFGVSDKIIKEMAEAWCIAKIKRLVGPLDPPIKPEYEEEFALAIFWNQRPSRSLKRQSVGNI